MHPTKTNTLGLTVHVDAFWQQSTKLADGEQFLTAARLRRLRSYIQGKSALYPGSGSCSNQEAEVEL
ncbi:MAG TPA: hypothetical protein PKN86_18595 [Candidatus Obscuribacter sp.]|nr:hypothetical protein [Candidatus Obscuribacter sp.]MBK9279268.1 hypothetical protein [Candidatus Obscuribacter sp.]HMY56073.1 hypothetical protein [Candidatus Obscuribacter sp.]HNA74322.1 hypothetical protein [Candidatus Obscuribacter sp.]HNB17111.1 hypothetical protein [Candidatus Obscuribacter sp.]